MERFLFSIQVRAKNEHGYGLLSVPLEVLTKPTKPDTPELECVERSYNSLKLAWKDRSATTSTSTRYLLQRNLKSGKASGKSKYVNAKPGFQLVTAIVGWIVILRTLP